jgi:hypothetical protein
MIASPETPRRETRRASAMASSTFRKGSTMSANQKDKGGSGKQGPGGASKQSGSPGSGAGTQGGSHEQHVAAGQQSHKNDGNKQSGSPGSGAKSPGGNKNR